jgi:transposase
VIAPSAQDDPSIGSVISVRAGSKIGELTLENDFLEGALTKAGLLSAKR